MEVDYMIDDLDFSKRLVNCLHILGVNNLSSLQYFTKEELFKIKGFGKKSFLELKERLDEAGIKLRDKRPLRELPSNSRRRYDRWHHRLPKCPFFNRPCLEEKCTAFSSYKRYVWDETELENYSNKLIYVEGNDNKYKGTKYFIVKLCHAFQREIELPEIRL